MSTSLFENDGFVHRCQVKTIESTLSISEHVIPLKIIPAATVYPKQLYWVNSPRNIFKNDVKYLEYFPVTQEEVTPSQLPSYYNTTYVRPLDSPKLERVERLIVAKLIKVSISTEQVQKIVRKIETFRDTNVSEEKLCRRALTEESKNYTCIQYQTFLAILEEAKTCRDSIVRILNLYGAYLMSTGLTPSPSSKLIRRSKTKPTECNCKTQWLATSIKQLLWTERDLESLAIGMEIYGPDCCALSKFVATKSCDMIKSLLDRRCIKSLAEFSQHYIKSVPNDEDAAIDHRYGDFVPCRHKESCNQASCRCYRNGKICTRFYHCPALCPRRHQGCRCMACGTGDCPCRARASECDPITCHNDCPNMDISRAESCRIVIKPSKIAGWGCFSNEYIPQGKFIMEYTGELISNEEAERRGFWYDMFGSNFLYELDSRTVVDATYIGTPARFCNHSCQANAQAEILWVQGELRIGIFAIEEINRDDEILIDYGESYVHKSFNKTAKVSREHYGK